MAKWTGKRANVMYTKPEEPSFLKKFKEQVGYKEDGGLSDKNLQTPLFAPCTVEEGAAAVGQQPQPKKKKQKRTYVTYTDEQEKELAEWFRDHPIFYNKSLKEYKDTDKKQRMYEEKAASLAPPSAGRNLRIWVDGMRTRFGRLSEKKEAEDDSKLSERDKWIRETFGFLYPHIVRVPSRQTAKFRVTTPTPSQPTPIEEIAVDSSEEEEVAVAASASDVGSVASTLKGKGKRSKAPTDDDAVDTVLAKLLERADQAKDLQQQVEILMKPKQTQPEHIRHWVNYQASQLVDIHPSLWDQYSIMSMNLLVQFKTESRRLRQLEEEQKQTPTQPTAEPPTTQQPNPPLQQKTQQFQSGERQRQVHHVHHRGFATMPEATDDDTEDKDDELPQVVSLKTGDLTQEEYDRLKAEGKLDDLLKDGECIVQGPKLKEEEPPPDGKIIFRKPTKRSVEDENKGDLKKVKSDEKSEKRSKKERKKEKQKLKLLSFDEDEEEEDF